MPCQTVFFVALKAECLADERRMIRDASDIHALQETLKPMRDEAWYTGNPLHA